MADTSKDKELNKAKESKYSVSPNEMLGLAIKMNLKRNLIKSLEKEPVYYKLMILKAQKEVISEIIKEVQDELKESEE